MIGARVGKWYLEEEIARGTLGPVYRARSFEEPDHRAAVKVITDPASRDPAILHKFAGEMLPLQRLEHINIARYLDCSTHGGFAYIATEFVEGIDGTKLLERGKREWREVLAIAVQAARALKHGHNRNLLHRDLKPAHFMLTAGGELKLLGFGLARVLSSPMSSMSNIGSAAYLPPEVASGKPPTRRGDFYSLGGVLYTFLTGRPPFIAASLVELTHKQCYALPERPCMIVPDLPPELDEFICGLLAKEPARRPAHAQALLDELERVRGKLERKGEQIDWPAKLQPDTAEMPSLHSMVPGLVEDAPAGVRNGLSRRVRLILYSAGLLLIAGVLFVSMRGGQSADELWAEAVPLVASDNPNDWDRAWDDCLEPLGRKYPDRFAEEVTAAKASIRDRKELRRVIAEGAKAEHRSEAELGYVLGLKYVQMGDYEAARTKWHAVANAFAAIESESRWVALSQAGLKALDRAPPHPPRSAADRNSLEMAIQQAVDLDHVGKKAEAQAIIHALEILVADDHLAVERVKRWRTN